jgi:hypothetical protein
MRIATICPTCATFINSVCVIYDGEYLANIDVAPGDTLDEILAKINGSCACTTTTTTSSSTSTSTTTSTSTSTTTSTSSTTTTTTTISPTAPVTIDYENSETADPYIDSDLLIQDDGVTIVNVFTSGTGTTTVAGGSSVLSQQDVQSGTIGNYTLYVENTTDSIILNNTTVTVGSIPATANTFTFVAVAGKAYLVRASAVPIP